MFFRPRGGDAVRSRGDDKTRLQLAARLEPGNPTYWYRFPRPKELPDFRGRSWRYGNFRLRQGDRKPAYAVLKRAISADPRRAAAAFSRAYRPNLNMDEILAKLWPAD